MSRRAGRGGHFDQRAELQAEADATTTAIAGLRRRLIRPGVFENPAVRRELRKLDELLAAFEQAESNPGRHRASGRIPGRHGGQETAEVGSPDLMPDPASARTAADFVAVLRKYRAWSGDVPWRTIAARAKQKRVHSTIYNAMRRDDLPTLEVVKAIIIGCGGGEDDLCAFTSAWQRINAVSAATHIEGPGLLPAPVPVL
jgi:hypothetical protein